VKQVVVNGRDYCVPDSDYEQKIIDAHDVIICGEHYVGYDDDREDAFALYETMNHCKSDWYAALQESLARMTEGSFSAREFEIMQHSVSCRHGMSGNRLLADDVAESFKYEFLDADDAEVSELIGKIEKLSYFDELAITYLLGLKKAEALESI